MPSKKIKSELVTKKEFIRRMSHITGFTQGNCTIALDAVVELMKEIMLEGRGIYFFKFGWLEPFKKPPRQMYRLNDKGIERDENGNRVGYIFPETTWLKFRMTEGFKSLINPGVYDRDNKENYKKSGD